MSLPRYPEYKDSGVEWLGQVPRHWQVCKFRHAFAESPEKIDSEVVGVMLSVSGYRGIEIKEYDDENRRRLDEELVGYRIVRPGQLVVNTMWLNYAGLGVSEHEGHVSPAYRSYWIAPTFNKRYVHHMMRCDSFVRGYTKFLTGIRPNSLQMSRDDLMAFQLLNPPADEQTAIAAFLDRETAKIDALIAEQEKLIALLAEKRQATISHAVTRGLNPNAPMKDSGVAWLGEVPAHWDIRRLKQIVRPGVSVSYGIVQPGEPLEEGTPFVQTSNMSDASFGLDQLQRTAREIAAAYPRSRLAGGEVILGIRASIGAAYVVPAHLAGANLSRGIARIECSDEVTSEYLVYGLRSSATMHYWGLSKQGSTFNEVSIETVRELALAIPPLNEQREIVDFIETELTRLNALQTQAERGVELLKERRNALIAAAVTGQIDVRCVSKGLASAEHAEEVNG